MIYNKQGPIWLPWSPRRHHSPLGESRTAETPPCLSLHLKCTLRSTQRQQPLCNCSYMMCGLLLRTAAIKAISAQKTLFVRTRCWLVVGHSMTEKRERVACTEIFYQSNARLKGEVCHHLCQPIFLPAELQWISDIQTCHSCFKDQNKPCAVFLFTKYQSMVCQRGLICISNWYSLFHL